MSRVIRSKTRGYNTYRLMISRCHKPSAKDYNRYGGAGISVCHRWRFGENGKDGFDCFYEDMGPCPEGLTLDRIENSKGYEVGNCRWADAKTQGLNKTNNYFAPGVDPQDKCREHGVKYKTFRNRVSRGQSIAQALSPRKTLVLSDGGAPLAEISKKHGISYFTLVHRWRAGLRGEDLLRRTPRSDKGTRKGPVKSKAGQAHG